MTRKDYIVIAEAIQTTRFRLDLKKDNIVLSTLIDLIAVQLKKDNRNFDYVRFAKACGQEMHS